MIQGGLPDERWNAKLTREQVKEIKRLYRTTDVTMRGLAQKYDISYSRIWNLIRGYSYKNVK